ncbi:helix-turn-helix transcriptional regulator [Streptomyces johnsoniae]|uniref:AAA family ATPase n=1 Tax=Streptomyces johnsoniae TaxID=3075532 RepID=A0ABU2S0L6_9ACTN|nr:AAA family ATPase [Streptomyces sp. DSM 41886]MDT0442553.1 AAA family ATPase [Streptomyces sp. DSM 41886]
MLTRTRPTVLLDSSSLLERAEELRSLEAMLASCHEGDGAFVLVEGGLGSGKSSLLRALRKGALGAGSTVLQARGTEFESGHPHGMVRQVLEHWLAMAGPAEREVMLSGHAAMAVPLLDHHEGLPPGGSDARQEEHVHRALLHLLTNLADERPLVLLLDDVHLADSASLRFLRYFGRHLLDRPILCCATTSLPATDGGEHGAAPGTVQAFLAPAVLRAFTLRPLSEDGVRAHLATALPGQLSHETVRAACAATAGNPFFLRELVSELAGARRAGRAPGPAHIAGIGPRTVARVVQRWSQHSPRRPVRASMSCVHALAVLGSAGSVAQLAEVAGVEPADAADAVDALREAGVIAQEVPLRFTAPIVRNAIYRHMPHSFRYRAHDAAAQSLFEEDAPPERIAEHLLHLPPATDGRAADVLVAAGRTALVKGDPVHALSLARRAAREDVPASMLPALLAVRGEAEHRTGHPHAARHLRQALELSTDSFERASIALHLGAALASDARCEEAAEVYRDAYGEVRTSHPSLARRLHAEHGWLGYCAPGTEEITAEISRELGVTASIGGAEGLPTTAQYLALRATRALLGGEPGDKVIGLVEQALSHDISVREGGVGARVPWFLAFCLFACGRLPEAGKLLDNAIQQAEPSDADSDDLRALRSCVNLGRGLLSEAENDATATLERSGASDERNLGRPFAVLALTELLLLRNQADAAEHEFAKHGGWEESRPGGFRSLPLMIARGHLHSARGAGGDDVQDCRRTLELLRETGSGASAFSPAPGIVRRLHALGQKEEAHRLALDHLAAARKFGVPHVVAEALSAYAGTVQGDEAVAALEESVRLLDGSPAAVSRCASLVQLGAVLSAAGQPTRARRRLWAAQEITEAAGTTVLSTRIRRELAAMGVRVRSTPRAGTPSLTPREQRVSALAAEGKRNHEIARILFVTVKTVEWHLSQVYRKLGIASRNELGRITAEDLEFTGTGSRLPAMTGGVAGGYPERSATRAAQNDRAGGAQRR